MLLPKLNFPEYTFSVRQTDGKAEIFDVVRKKFVALTPEEWVRQNLIHYLNECKKYPIGLFQVEGSITVNSMPKRCDIIVYNNSLKPLLLVECKKPSVVLNQKIFDQATLYNLSLEVPYILITNGLKHSCFSMNRKEGKVQYHSEIPDWDTLRNV